MRINPVTVSNFVELYNDEYDENFTIEDFRKIALLIQPYGRFAGTKNYENARVVRQALPYGMCYVAVPYLYEGENADEDGNEIREYYGDDEHYIAMISGGALYGVHVHTPCLYDCQQNVDEIKEDEWIEADFKEERAFERGIRKELGLICL